MFDANSNTALTNSTTTNPPPPTTNNNDDDKTTSGVKNPRELFPGRPGPAQDGNNNDGFQGKFCLLRMGYFICRKTIRLAVKVREGGYIGLFITLIPKVLN